MMKNKAVFAIVSTLLFSGCSTNKEPIQHELPKVIDYAALPFKNTNGNISAVIEIPAGTNHKYEYNYESKKFECELINDKPRVVNFLPYPANYGFIPGTYMNPEIGGDGDALDVLVLAESIPQGEIVEIMPIGTLKLLDHKEEDHKIIAIPVDNNLKIISGDSLNEATKTIIETWFTNYKGAGKIQFLGWTGKDSTMIEINKWVK